MPITKLGPGTITVGQNDFAAEVKSVSITHGYDETSEATTYLDGSSSPAQMSRSDGVKFDCDNDLTAAGVYAFIQDNDLTEQSFSYVPNTDAGAEWAGTVQIKLPDEVGADAYGNPIASSVEWAAVGKLTFTAAGEGG